MNRRGYCIFIDTVFQGPVPSVTEVSSADFNNAPEQICVFPTKLEAQREVADSMMTRLDG